MNLTTDLGTKELIIDFTVDDIKWPGGEALFNWWNSARGSRKFPAREDFSPLVMPSFLSSIILYEINGGGQKYAIKLAGSAIADLMGFDPTGVWLSDLPGTENQCGRFDWVEANKAPYICMDIPAVWANKEFKTYSTLVMPLGPSDDKVTMLITSVFFERNKAALEML